MDKLIFLNEIIKYFFISLFTLYIYKKIVDYNNKSLPKIIVCIISSFILGCFYTLLIDYINSLFIILSIILILSIIIMILTEIKKIHTIFVTFLSMVITLVFFNLSLFITVTIGNITYSNINGDNPITRLIILLITFLLEFIFVYRFFKIKRLVKRFFFCEK